MNSLLTNLSYASQVVLAIIGTVALFATWGQLHGTFRPILRIIFDESDKFYYIENVGNRAAFSVSITPKTKADVLYVSKFDLSSGQKVKIYSENDAEEDIYIVKYHRSRFKAKFLNRLFGYTDNIPLSRNEFPAVREELSQRIYKIQQKMRKSERYLESDFVVPWNKFTVALESLISAHNPAPNSRGYIYRNSLFLFMDYLGYKVEVSDRGLEIVGIKKSYGHSFQNLQRVNQAIGSDSNLFKLRRKWGKHSHDLWIEGTVEHHEYTLTLDKERGEISMIRNNTNTLQSTIETSTFKSKNFW